MRNLLEWIKATNIQNLISFSAFVRLLLIGNNKRIKSKFFFKISDSFQMMFIPIATQVFDGVSFD